MYKFLGMALAGLAATTAAHAVNYTTTVTIGYDPNAATSNFPGVGPGPGTTNNETAYTIRTGIDATNFYVDVATTGSSGNDLSNYDFANIYVGGATFNDSLVIEVTNDQFYFNGGGPYSLAGTGFTYSSTGNPSAGVADISFALPLAYLENDPSNLGFSTPKLAAGDQVRVSYAQAYGYSFVGGTGNYGTNRLGSQIIPAPAPEPAAWAMMLIGFGAIGAMARRSARRAAFA